MQYSNDYYDNRRAVYGYKSQSAIVSRLALYLIVALVLTLLTGCGNSDEEVPYTEDNYYPDLARLSQLEDFRKVK